MYDQQRYLNLGNLKKVLILEMILGDIEHNHFRLRLHSNGIGRTFYRLKISSLS